MQKAYLEEPRWRGVRFIKGLLGQAPAVSLQLDPFEEELYSNDVDGIPIEDLIPDYSICRILNINTPFRCLLYLRF